MARILLVDDALGGLLPTLQDVLEEHAVSGAQDGKEALEFLRRDEDVDLVLLDVHMPACFGPRDEEEGLAVFQELQKEFPLVPVIFLSSYDDLGVINRALKAGGFWYAKKLSDFEELRLTVERGLLEGARRRERREQWLAAREMQRVIASGAGRRRSRRSSFDGFSPAIEALRGEIRAYAPYEVSVLLLGETGSGKELVAREIHRQSLRRQQDLVVANCNGYNDPHLARSELFGYCKGAFTGANKDRAGLIEQANHSTLFLDEIGDLDLGVQGLLLRVVQFGEVTRVGPGERPRHVDVRFIFATNRDPDELVRAGAMREDFKFRISAGMIRVPSLRERLEDLPALAARLLARLLPKQGLRECRLSGGAVERLLGHSWPGNVRELENVLVRGAIRAVTAGRQEIAPEDLELGPCAAAPGGGDPEMAEAPGGEANPLDRIIEDGGYPGSLKEMRRELGDRRTVELLGEALRRTRRQTVREAARLLGLLKGGREEKDYENLRTFLSSVRVNKVHLLEGRYPWQDPEPVPGAKQ